MLLKFLEVFSILTTSKLFPLTAANEDTIFNITSVEEKCTSLVLSAEVFPQKAFSFTWNVNSGNNSSISLANITLLDSASIALEKLDNSFLSYSDYDVIHPAKLKFLKQPFTIKLNVKNLRFTNNLQFKLISDLQTYGVNVPALTCSYPRDLFCLENCLNQSLCGTNFTKLCDDGELVIQDCPANVTTMKFSRCRKKLGYLGATKSISVFYAMVGVAGGVSFIALLVAGISYHYGVFGDTEGLFELKYRICNVILLLIGAAMAMVGIGMVFGLPVKKGSLGIFLIIAGTAIFIFATFASSYLIAWNRRMSWSESTITLKKIKSSKRSFLDFSSPAYIN